MSGAALLWLNSEHPVRQRIVADPVTLDMFHCFVKLGVSHTTNVVFWINLRDLREIPSLSEVQLGVRLLQLGNLSSQWRPQPFVRVMCVTCVLLGMKIRFGRNRQCSSTKCWVASAV